MKRLAIISNYPPCKCGIAKYTEHLATSLRKLCKYDIHIISEGGKEEKTQFFSVHDIYSRNSKYKQTIINAVKEINPDIIHIQHALVLFPDTSEFLELVEEIKAMGIKLFITIHTADIGKNQKINWNNFYKRVLACGTLIVHNKMCLDSIIYYGIPVSNVAVIPHGTVIQELFEKSLSRKHLNLPQNSFIFLILGFIHLFKNHHTAIMAFNFIRKQKNCHLLIAGNADRNTLPNRIYVFVCKLLSLFSRKIIWHDHFIKDEDIYHYLSSSDVILMPYWQNYPSASGIFHLTIGCKLPVICSDSVKFSEVKDVFHDKPEIFVPTLNIKKWKEIMEKVLSEPELLEFYKEKLFIYAKSTDWEKVAKAHCDLFENETFLDKQQQNA